jgi:hypothetical protein
MRPGTALAFAITRASRGGAGCETLLTVHGQRPDEWNNGRSCSGSQAVARTGTLGYC